MRRLLVFGLICIYTVVSICSLTLAVSADARPCSLEIAEEIQRHFFETVPPASADLDYNDDGLIDVSDYSICLVNIPTDEPDPEIVINPVISFPSVNFQGNCTWEIQLAVSGFAPNSSLYLSLPSADTRDCAGNPVGVGYERWNIGSTNENGSFQFGIHHGEWGTYNYKLEDDDGNVAYATVQYAYEVPPEPNDPNDPPDPEDNDEEQENNDTSEVTNPSTRCVLEEFTADPGRGSPGTRFTLRAKGNCEQGTRAMRIGTRLQGADHVLGELGSTQIEFNFDSTGITDATLTLFAVITNGSWETAARAELNIQLPPNEGASGFEKVGPVDNCHLVSCHDEEDQGGGNNDNNDNQEGSVSSGCPAAPTRLSVGMRPTVADADPYPLAIRREPSRNSPKVLDIPIRQPVIVREGPRCNEERIWWLVEYDGYTGWAVEVGSQGLYNLIPPSSENSNNDNGESGVVPIGDCSGTLPPRMLPGRYGRVTFTDGSPTALWDVPQGNPIRQIPEGGTFEVLGERICTPGARGGNLSWWPVVLPDGTPGWMSEGYAGGDYWIEPTSIAIDNGETFHRVITSYSVCNYDSYFVGTIPSTTWDMVTAGFGNAKSNACNRETGEINYTIVAFGGVEGSYAAGVTHEASAVAYIETTFIPTFTGEVDIEIIFTINGHAEVSAGSGLALELVNDILGALRNAIITHLIPLDTAELNNLKTLIDALRSPTVGLLRQKLFMTVNNGMERVTIENKLDGELHAAFPIGPNFIDNHSYLSRQFTLTTRAKVFAGKTASIRAGIETISETYGWSVSFWNLRTDPSYVNSIEITQIK